MVKALNDYVKIYEELLKQGDIQVAYKHLLKCMMTLKAHLASTASDKYTFGNVSPGYMDFTYFPFFNNFLRAKKLRFGVVLNHQKMRFELWLMGQNKEVQTKYWQLLKHSKWNNERVSIPKYSVLEEVLLNNPDFNNLSLLTADVATRAIHSTEEIQNVIKNI